MYDMRLRGSINLERMLFVDASGPVVATWTDWDV